MHLPRECCELLPGLPEQCLSTKGAESVIGDFQIMNPG
jgi:hypothetical protein